MIDAATESSDVVTLRIPTPVLPLSRLAAMIEYAKSFVIDSAETAELAASEYTDTRELLKRLTAEQEYDLEPIKEAERRTRARYRPGLDAGKLLSEIWNKKIAAHHDREKALEREAQIKARELQRQEQERLAHEAAKREAEAQEQAAKLRATALAEAQAGNQTAAAELVRRADQAEMAGQQDAQEMIEQLQLTAPAPVPRAQTPSGITPRKQVEIKALDVAETAVAVAEGRVPSRALKHDLVWLRSHAINMGEQFDVPGVLAEWHTVVATKGKR